MDESVVAGEEDSWATPPECYCRLNLFGVSFYSPALWSAFFGPASIDIYAFFPSILMLSSSSISGAFGKALGTCARVAIGQVLLSVRCKDNHAQEALRRAKFKFHGRQKIIISRKWGFTKFNRAEFTKLRQQKCVVPDGVNAKE